MAGVEDGCEAGSWLEGIDPAEVSMNWADSSISDLHDAVHLIIHNMSGLPKVDRVDDLVISILFVAVQVLRLPAMSGVVEEKRVVRPGVLHQPVHGSQYVRLCRLAHRVVLVIRQAHHVLSLVAEVSIQVGGHVLHVVDAPSQLAALAEIVDSNQESLSSTGAVGVLEGVPAGRAVSCDNHVSCRISVLFSACLPKFCCCVGGGGGRPYPKKTSAKRLVDCVSLPTWLHRRWSAIVVRRWGSVILVVLRWRRVVVAILIAAVLRWWRRTTVAVVRGLRGGCLVGPCYRQYCIQLPCRCAGAYGYC